MLDVRLMRTYPVIVAETTAIGPGNPEKRGRTTAVRRYFFVRCIIAPSVYGWAMVGRRSRLPVPTFRFSSLVMCLPTPSGNGAVGSYKM